MKNAHSKIYYLLFILALFILPSTLFADAGIVLDPAQYEARTNEVFEIELYMSSTDEPINAVSAHVNYNPDVLELISYRRTSERVSFWIDTDNDVNDGSIMIEGLLMDTGWQGKREKLARMTFRVKKIGSTEIGIDNAALHAYDGTGENILDHVTQSIITVTPGGAREEYKYIARGITDVDENQTPDILYDDNYQREYRVVHIMPWWAWILSLVAIILFIWTWRTQRRLRYYMDTKE